MRERRSPPQVRELVIAFAAMASSSAPAAKDTARGSSQTPATGKTWRADGEVLRACIPLDLPFSRVWHPQGTQGSFRWWQEYAAELGILFSIRGRKKRKNNVPRTTLILSGRQGTTARFYAQMRQQWGQLLGSTRGFPVACQATIYHVGLDGLLETENGQILAPDAPPGLNEAEQEEEPDSDNEVSEPETEVLMQRPFERAREVASAETGAQSSVPPPALDTSIPAFTDASDGEDRADQVLMALCAQEFLKVLFFRGSSGQVGISWDKIWLGARARAWRGPGTGPGRGPGSGPGSPRPDFLTPPCHLGFGPPGRVSSGRRLLSRATLRYNGSFGWRRCKLR